MDEAAITKQATRALRKAARAGRLPGGVEVELKLYRTGPVLELRAVVTGCDFPVVPRAWLDWLTLAPLERGSPPDCLTTQARQLAGAIEAELRPVVPEAVGVECDFAADIARRRMATAVAVKI